MCLTGTGSCNDFLSSSNPPHSDSLLVAVPQVVGGDFVFSDGNSKNSIKGSLHVDIGFGFPSTFLLVLDHVDLEGMVSFDESIGPAQANNMVRTSVKKIS